jgi:S-DNA-T family DNA segregation ATPase FtsK/SpoIIIE
MLQRKFRIGYNRAARIMDQLEEKGLVSPMDGANKRRVLIGRSNTQV